MIEKDTDYIICLRRSDTKWATITENSSLSNCAECDEPVWISPASIKIMLDRDLKPLCIYCAAECGDEDKTIKPPSVEQVKEIIRELKKEAGNENPTDRFPGGTNKRE